MLKFYIDPVRHTHERHLSQPLRCTTRRSVKRKRSDDIQCTNMEQTTNLEQTTFDTTPSEKQSSSDSDYKPHEISSKRKKMKYITK